MVSPIHTIQYLEDSAAVRSLDKVQLVVRLHQAVERFPFTHLLIGWQLPMPVLEACRSEAERLGLHLLRWQPLLTTDKGFRSDPSWQVEGLNGNKVLGYQGQPEFTFFCPNHPALQDALLEHLESLLHSGIYQGFFLDRVRFPSPSLAPAGDLACFCEHCRRKAADLGVDLDEIRQVIINQLKTKEGRLLYINALLAGQPAFSGNDPDSSLNRLLAFRQQSIVDILTCIARPIREAHLEIGLDCFSPCFTRLVGQDLQGLGRSVDWIKLMTYAHTIAPAGLPFEFLGLARFLEENQLGEEAVLKLLSHSTGLQLPASIQELMIHGLSPSALQVEVKRGMDAVSVPVIAGVELVDLPGVTSLHPGQIRADVKAIKETAPGGLAISWDLLHIPLERLDLVSRIYFERA